jgi:hypothetical protein
MTTKIENKIENLLKKCRVGFPHFENNKKLRRPYRRYIRLLNREDDKK